MLPEIRVRNVIRLFVCTPAQHEGRQYYKHQRVGEYFHSPGEAISFIDNLDMASYNGASFIRMEHGDITVDGDFWHDPECDQIIMIVDGQPDTKPIKSWFCIK